MFSAFFLMVLIYGLSNYSINFPGRSYTLFELLFDPVIRVVNLEPYGNLYGSISNRTDMIIYAIKDFIASYGIGIGPGNSLSLLASDKYPSIGSAKSLHNFPLQLVVELGLPIIIAIVLMLKSKLTVDKIFVFSFIMLSSLSQSVGIFSNYYFLHCLFFIILLKR
jgi:hypothetical protein